MKEFGTEAYKGNVNIFFYAKKEEWGRPQQLLPRHICQALTLFPQTVDFLSWNASYVITDSILHKNS